MRKPAFCVVLNKHHFFCNLQVLNKQVIARTSGNSLGIISACWVHPDQFYVVSVDLIKEKTNLLSSAQRVGNIPLAAFKQIGDVVLVHDDAVLMEQDLDGRLGYINPIGMDVLTMSGQALGKVSIMARNTSHCTVAAGFQHQP